MSPLKLVMAAAVLGLSIAQAQPAPTLTLEQVLTEARANRQEIRAAAARADAAAQTPKVVGALPDPMLMGGLDHLPFSLMGANYSVQEADKGNFGSYKTATKQFYEEKDRQTKVKPAIYHTGPLSTTPVDISGRPSC